MSSLLRHGSRQCGLAGNLELGVKGDSVREIHAGLILRYHGVKAPGLADGGGISIHAPLAGSDSKLSQNFYQKIVRSALKNYVSLLYESIIHFHTTNMKQKAVRTCQDNDGSFSFALNHQDTFRVITFSHTEMLDF